MCLVYGAMFATIGVHLPFWPVWLAGRGLSASEIGLVIATGFVVRGVTAPWIGSLSDRAPDRRLVLGAAACVALLAGVMFHFSGGLASILLASAIMSVAFGAVGPLCENLAMLLATARAFDYGRVRALGSIAFVVAAVAGGWVLVGRSSEAVLALILALLGLVVASCLVLPAAPPAPPAAARGEVWPLLRQPMLLWLLAAVTLIQCSHAFFYAFGTLEMRRMGIPEGAIGVLWSCGVLGEIVLFWRGQSVLRRFDPVALVAIAGAGGIARWSLMMLTASVPVLALVTMLHALTFACCHLGMMILIARAVPVSHSATAQGLFAAVSNSFGMGAAMAFAGWLYAGFGALGYVGMAAMAGIGILAGIMVGRNWDGEQLDLARGRRAAL
jgi:PPP family 3-phenylpropionic acid transporter